MPGSKALATLCYQLVTHRPPKRIPMSTDCQQAAICFSNRMCPQINALCSVQCSDTDGWVTGSTSSHKKLYFTNPQRFSSGAGGGGGGPERELTDSSSCGEMAINPLTAIFPKMPVPKPILDTTQILFATMLFVCFDNYNTYCSQFVTHLHFFIDRNLGSSHPSVPAVPWTG